MMMLRPSTWLWLALVGAVGFGMFQVKYQVMRLEDRLARVNRDIDNDRAQMRVLEAEWSFLNQAPRLDQLRRRYLSNLAPIAGNDFGSLDQIPFRRGETPPTEAKPQLAPMAQPSAPVHPPLALPGGPALASARPGASR